MIIKTTEFICSNTDYKKCPEPDLPEYAFIGRSNVGKSSLINMLTNRKNIARISNKPGKTQLINHFKINDSWFLVDLPGYGFAKVSKEQRNKWTKLIEGYIFGRTNLMSLFVLIDARLEPQAIDLDFMQNLGENQIPFAMVFTKTDKISSGRFKKNLQFYNKKMVEIWEQLPPQFYSSAINKNGKDEILNYIGDTNKLFIPE